jgi:TniQ protein/regulatory helix-turn-helix LysR family protein
MTAGMGERSLPLRVAIRDGEALDSWLEVLARRSSMAVSQLLLALGLPPTAIHAHHALVEGLTPPALRRIERQTGLPTGRLDTAVFECYTALGWPMLDGSRWCPACLTETGGRWPLRWRLPWMFACRRHQVLLGDRCPTCGLAPRRRLGAAAGLQPAASCPNLIRRGQLCATDLRTQPARLLPVDDPLATQRWIEQRLVIVESAIGTSRTSESGIDEAGDPITALRDLHAVGQWRRVQSSLEDYQQLGQEAVEAFTAYLARQRGGRRPGQHAFTDSLLVGITATFAMALLTATRAEDILTRLRPLTVPPPGANEATPRARATRLGHYYQWRTVSPAAQARFLTALDPHLQPVDRLRYRSCGRTPRLPRSDHQVLDRGRHIPQLLWPEWSVRFTPSPRCAPPDAFRAALSVCLLIPGRFEKNEPKTAAELCAFRPRHASVILRRLVTQSGDGVLTAICLLADYLDAHGAPIDYQLRRTLITEHVLTEQQWKQLCQHTQTHPGKGQSRRGPSSRYCLARRYLFQLLTGADLNDTRHALAYRGPGDRARHLNAVQKMSTPLRNALHGHAARHLNNLGIDEPVSWAPPASVCAELKLPGRDPDDLDVEHLQRLIIDHDRSLCDAARELNTTLEHVRLVIERVQRDPEPWAARLAQAQRHRKEQRRAQLTREFFEREVGQAAKSRTQLRDETGIPINDLTRYAKQVGVALVGRHPIGIDPTWLADQYINRRRSFPDIAKEVGASPQTLADTARRHGIPVRSPGIQSHPDMITKLDPSLPTDIRRAVEGQLHGWQRLRRFQQAMAYRSITAASKDLHVDASTFASQFNRLEHDIGGRLLHRSTPTQRQRLTPRGTRLLAALDDPRARELLDRHGHPPRTSKTRLHGGGHRNLPARGHEWLPGDGQVRHRR